MGSAERGPSIAHFWPADHGRSFVPYARPIDVAYVLLRTLDAASRKFATRGGDQRFDFSPFSEGGSGRASNSEAERMLGGVRLMMNGAAGAGMEAGKGMAGEFEISETASSAGLRYTATILRPLFLASYSAKSAAFTRSSACPEATSVLPAQPTLAVIRTSSLPKLNCCLRKLPSRRSATIFASFLLVCGKRMANSSPP